MKRNITIACLFLSILVFSDKAQAQRLFVLVAGDTADEVVCDGVRQNMAWIKTAFRSGVPEDRLVVRFLQGEKLTKDSIVGSVKSCPVGEDDSLVFWWLGRGAFEQAQRILLLPDGSKLESSAIRDILAARPSRLAVMIIDAYQRAIPSTELPPKTMDMVRTDTLSPVFHSLFFEPRGLIQVDSAESGQRPLLLTTTGGLLTTSLLLPPGVLGDIDNDAGFVTLHTPTGDRELVLERGLLWHDLNDSVEWDTILSQLRSVTSANYRRAMGSKHVGTGQTPTFAGTRLKYADHFVEWQPVSGDFRSRPRETRVQIEGGQEVRYQGDKKISLGHIADTLAQPDAPPSEEIPSEEIPSREIPRENKSADTADNDRSATELDSYEPFPTDHLIKINRLPIRTASDFHHAMRSLESNSGDIEFVVVDNQSGKQIHYKTRMNPQTDRDFGIKPWFWKDSFVVLHEVRPESPAARAKAVRIVDAQLPEEIGLGIRGSLVEIDNPLHKEEDGTDAQRMIGVKVDEVTDPGRSDLKPGDVVFMIDGNDFRSAEGYRYALQNARMLAGLWYVDGRTGEPKHGIVSLPHTPPKEFVEPPPGTGTISITPADIESSPIW